MTNEQIKKIIKVRSRKLVFLVGLFQFLIIYAYRMDDRVTNLGSLLIMFIIADAFLITAMIINFVKEVLLDINNLKQNEQQHDQHS